MQLDVVSYATTQVATTDERLTHQWALLHMLAQRVVVPAKLSALTFAAELSLRIASSQG